MKIRKNTLEISCDICGAYTHNILELEEFTYVSICQDCMQELSRMIVEDLIDENV